jgi:hypothetical protein
MDWLIISVTLLLLTTFGAFLLDIIPYPVGAIVLLFLLVLRLKRMRTRGA